MSNKILFILFIFNVFNLFSSENNVFKVKTLDLSFSEIGVIYIGENKNSQDVILDGKKIKNQNTVFKFKFYKPGKYLLLFFSQDLDNNKLIKIEREVFIPEN